MELQKDQNRNKEDLHRGIVCKIFKETLCKGHKQISNELSATVIVYSLHSMLLTSDKAH